MGKQRKTGNGRSTPTPDRAAPLPVTIPPEEAARHLGMTPRALRIFLKKVDAACLVRVSPRVWRIDRRGFFKLLERIGFDRPGSGGHHAGG